MLYHCQARPQEKTCCFLCHENICPSSLTHEDLLDIVLSTQYFRSSLCRLVVLDLGSAASGLGNINSVANIFV